MNQPTIKVRDLGLAAALVSCGYEIKETYQETSGRSYFIFIETDGLNRAVTDYWADVLVVRARKLSDNIKMLKSLIYSKQ